MHMFTFVVTTTEDPDPYQVIQYYCGRGKMENFIVDNPIHVANVLPILYFRVEDFAKNISS